jgi:hypothetical protein
MGALMLLVPLEERQAVNGVRPTDRVLLRCDEKGCTLSSGKFEQRFSDPQTAMEYARRSRETATATIEIWQDGQYICCSAPPSTQRSEAEFLSGPRLFSDARLAAADRRANHVGRALMATAGPIFWLCLVVLVVATALGWQLIRQ